MALFIDAGTVGGCCIGQNSGNEVTSSGLSERVFQTI